MSSEMESLPLIKWINGLLTRGGAHYDKGDLYLTPLAARRFALSLYEKTPFFAGQKMTIKHWEVLNGKLRP